jgi:putative tricarboxylic transport membrane protein
MPTKLRAAMRLAAPLAAAAASVMLAHHFVAPGVNLDAMSRGLASPGTWPKTMLYCAAACAAVLFVRNLYLLRRPAAPGGGGEPTHAGYDDAKLLPGIALLVAYGFGITQVGMAWATLAFIAAWLVLSGLRRPLVVVLVSGLGTAAILYLFVKVSLMPLDRGKGAFEQATIFLYRLLGIY